MAEMSPLSDAAIALLVQRIATKDVTVNDDNRKAYRELVRAGVMYPVSGFVGGPDGLFRFTKETRGNRGEWLRSITPTRARRLADASVDPTEACLRNDQAHLPRRRGER
jgi:hypothetical protein